jgi:guanylate kinase
MTDITATLSRLAQLYLPDDTARQILSQVDVMLLVGISGAGKDTIQSRLLETGNYHRITTHTTRPPRANNGVMEQNGREYHFVSYEQMESLLIDHKLIEVNQYGANFYGTSLAEFEIASHDGKVAVGDIDINGITAFRHLSDTARAVFIIPPDYTSWRTRLSKRYSSTEEFEAEFPDRRTTAIAELEHALSVPYYHFIINDDLDRAVRVVDEIAHRRDSFNQHDDEARIKARELLDAIKSA